MEDVHVMWTIPQIAERDGVTKQAVSKTVQKLIEAHALPVNRDGRGRVSAVSLAHYDHLQSRFTNPAKREPAAAPKPIAQTDSFDEARRQEAWLKVTREKLLQQERLGQLIRKDFAADGLVAAGREVQAIINRLPNLADDLALAVSKDGVHGARLLLRDKAFALNSEIADCLARLSLEAPETDDVIDGEA